jgi:hypothetical protein
MNIFKLPSFLKRGASKPKKKQGHSSKAEERSDPEEGVGKPILAEENTDANSQRQEDVPEGHRGQQSRRRRKKKTQSQDG